MLNFTPFQKAQQVIDNMTAEYNKLQLELEISIMTGLALAKNTGNLEEF